jgi:hypothetical protein
MRAFVATVLGAAVIAGVAILKGGQNAPPDDLIPLDASVPVVYSVENLVPSSTFRETDRDLARWAVEAWQAASGGAVHFTAGDPSAAALRIQFVPSSAGQYGEMRPTLLNGRRGAIVYVRPDTDALGADIAREARRDSLFRDTIVYLTCVHEVGHALGLTHTSNFADVMYFFGYGGDIPYFFERYRRQLRGRADIARFSGLSNNDVERLRELHP